MTNVVQFPGETTLDIDPERILEGAKGKLESVLVVGFTKDGEDYFASSSADAADAIFHLERAKHLLMKIIDEASD